MAAQWARGMLWIGHEEESGEEVLARERYLYEHRAGGPGKTIPIDAYARAVQQHLALPKDRDDFASPTALINWQSANPVGMFYARTNNNYIAGRTNYMVFHPTDPNTFYCAAAGGGIWKTTNGGVNWTPLTDFLTSLASGGIAIDPNNSNVLYYGTGEQNYSGDSWYGDGIYKSTNAGASWTKVATTSVGTKFSEIVVEKQIPTLSTRQARLGS
ncbi:MAG: hypothetical protein AAB209_00270, partial [Bacteroidota bacterium]